MLSGALEDNVSRNWYVWIGLSAHRIVTFSLDLDEFISISLQYFNKMLLIRLPLTLLNTAVISRSAASRTP